MLRNAVHIPYLNNGSFILLIVTLTRILKTQLTTVEKKAGKFAKISCVILSPSP